MSTLGKLKDLLTSMFTHFGQAFVNLIQVVSFILKAKIDTKEFLTHAAKISYGTMLPVFTITTALGVVIGVQLAPEFVSKGLGSHLGILSALTMTRELAPVIGSMVIATQYGTGVAAEIANMKITEQVDALKVFRVNPLYYLVTPRFLAALIFTPLVIWLASLIGVFSTYITCWLTEDISWNGFMNSIWTYLKPDDVYLCLFKSSVFGAMIILIASTLGLETEGGAKEVGKTTTLTVIVSFVSIIAVDFLITWMYL